MLEDPTGRRAVWLRRAGRVIFILFLGWLLAIVLGGLGLAPVPGIPLTHALGTTHGPPPLARLPEPRQPSASDLRPAVSAKSFVAGQTAVPSARLHHVVSHPKKHRVHVRTSITPVHRHPAVPFIVTSPGRSASAPGHTKTTPITTTPHGRSATAPGQTKTTTPSVTTTHGRSSTAPGKTKTTPTATTALHGRSAIARGRTKTTSSTTTTTTVTTTPQHGRSAK